MSSWPERKIVNILREILLRALVELLSELLRYLSSNPGGTDGGD